MAKLVKLTGLKSYVNSVTKTVILKKGDVARFADKVADSMLDLHRTNADNEQVPLFTEVPNGTPYTYDFSGEPKAAVITTAEEVETEAEDVEGIGTVKLGAIPPAKSQRAATARRAGR